jgi:hypothetical protein
MTVQYLSQVDVPPCARVVEIGSGTGAISRLLAAWPGLATARSFRNRPASI